MSRALYPSLLLLLPLLSCGAGDAPDAEPTGKQAQAQSDFRRTVVLIHGRTAPGQDLFVRGGIDHARARTQLGIDCTAENRKCAIPIRHLNDKNATTQPHKTGDTLLDWYGREPGQSAAAVGTPADWSTNAWPSTFGPKKTVAVDGFGETPLNQFGSHYWLLDVEMDCSRAFPANGKRWFELKSFVSDGPGWERDITQAGAPFASANHVGECGQVNVFRRDEGIALTYDLQKPERAVRIAAVGDVSDAKIGDQRKTSDLVVDGGDEAVLLLGDLQYPNGELANFQQFFDPTWGRLKPLLRPTPGNHEYKTAGAQGYFQYFGAQAGDPTKGYSSFDIGDWHVIALNSNDHCAMVPCGAGSPQEQWLRRDLAANTKKCTLAYWHHPRFSSGKHGNAPSVSALWNALYEAGADVVLVGHEHLYERFAPQTPSAQRDDARGLRQFTVGTGGIGFYGFGAAQPNSEVRADGSFGVLRMSLRAESYAWEFVPAEGSAFTDSGLGRCH